MAGFKIANPETHRSFEQLFEMAHVGSLAPNCARLRLGMLTVDHERRVHDLLSSRA